MLNDEVVRYEVRPRSFGEILDLGFRIVRDHFSLLLTLAGTFYIPLGVIGIVLQASLAGGEAAASFIVSMALLMALFVVVSPLVSAAITYAVGEVFLGRRVSAAVALRQAMSILMPLLGTALVAGIIVLLGFVLLIIPGIYLGLSYLLLWQVGVLERQFGTRGLRRSRDLMRGNLLRGFGILLVSGLIIGIINGVLQFALGSLPYLGALASSVAQAVGAAYSAAVTVVLYFDIRCRKEAFDIEHLARTVHAAAGSAAPASGLPPGAPPAGYTP